MKHKLSSWKLALPIIALACLVVLPQAIQAQENTQIYLPLIMGGQATTSYDYAVVDTGQTACYNDSGEISCPVEGGTFYGQDAQFDGNQPSYTLSADGLTVYDNVTGLTWTQSPDLDGDGDIDVDDKLTFAAAQAYVNTLNAQNYGGYSDWRVPSIKELYSLINFDGTDPPPTGNNTAGLIPFIDTDYFAFAYGDTAAGERIIDAQFLSNSEYVGTVFGGQSAIFGVNFADGRIKGYPSDKAQFVYFVSGNPDYGANSFVDNGDGTVTDNATGLMWSQDDSGTGMNWEDALAWVQQKNDENYLGYSDWRLPNAKELQSIVDYERSPDTTGSAAIAPVFSATQITNAAGQADYPFYWTSTTHIRSNGSGAAGVYICFGRGLGSMDGVNVIDVHGAGCQRSDPKDGDPSNYPSWGHGPQGDVQRVFNYVRLVRGGTEFVEVTDSGTGELVGQSPIGNQPPGGQLPGGSQSAGGGQPLTGGQQPGGNQPPSGGRLPTGGQSPMGGTPPQEAISACSGLSENATCTVATPQGTLNGTCMLIQSQLACVTQGGPPPGAP
jgi:hypothetical protein